MKLVKEIEKPLSSTLSPKDKLSQVSLCKKLAEDPFRVLVWSDILSFSKSGMEVSRLSLGEIWREIHAPWSVNSSLILELCRENKSDESFQIRFMESAILEITGIDHLEAIRAVLGFSPPIGSKSFELQIFFVLFCLVGGRCSNFSEEEIIQIEQEIEVVFNRRLVQEHELPLEEINQLFYGESQDTKWLTNLFLKLREMRLAEVVQEFERFSQLFDEFERVKPKSRWLRFADVWRLVFFQMFCSAVRPQVELNSLALVSCESKPTLFIEKIGDFFDFLENRSPGVLMDVLTHLCESDFIDWESFDPVFVRLDFDLLIKQGGFETAYFWLLLVRNSAESGKLAPKLFDMLCKYSFPYFTETQTSELILVLSKETCLVQSPDFWLQISQSCFYHFFSKQFEENMIEIFLKGLIGLKDPQRKKELLIFFLKLRPWKISLTFMSEVLIINDKTLSSYFFSQQIAS